MGTEIEKAKVVSHAMVTLAAVVVVIAGIKAASEIVIPVLLAAFVAILCSPLLSWFERRGVPRAIALFLIISGVVIGGIGLVTLLGTSIQDFSKDMPVYEEKLQEQVRRVVTWFQEQGVNTSGVESYKVFDAGSIMRYTARLLNGLRGALTNGFIILMIVIFMLMEASSIPAKLTAVVGTHQEALAGLDAFLKSVNRYMAIKTLTSLGTGILVIILLMILKVKYALLWGLLAFLLNYVPNIGSILAAIPAVLLALIQLGPLTACGTVVGYIAINVVVGNVIEPRIMGEGLGLSTLVVFLSLIFWGWVLGPVGMLLSIPLTVMVKIALDTNKETRWLSILLGR
jgi:predicted PurR-regulated permease PerM